MFFGGRRKAENPEDGYDAGSNMGMMRTCKTPHRPELRIEPGTMNRWVYDEGGDRGYRTLHYITLREQQCSPTWLFIANSNSLQTDASSAMSCNESQAEQDRKHLGEMRSGRLSDMNEMLCHKWNTSYIHIIYYYYYHYQLPQTRVWTYVTRETLFWNVCIIRSLLG